MAWAGPKIKLIYKGALTQRGDNKNLLCMDGDLASPATSGKPDFGVSVIMTVELRLP
jgi:hypothetical protein